MSEPTVPPTPAASTSDAELLAELRRVEARLYDGDVVAQVAALPADQREAFVSSRLQLTAAVTRLDARMLGRLETEMQGQDVALRQGVADLDRSLGQAQEVASWTGAVNGVLGLLGSIAPLV